MHYRRKERHGDPMFINPKCNRDGNYKTRARIKTAKWKQDNKKSYNAYLATCKKCIKKATPDWVNKKHLEQIYRDCPDDRHVDHIIPLSNKIVSGLNVPWNLQYLPKIDNLIKGNKFDGTYDNQSWKTSG